MTERQNAQEIENLKAEQRIHAQELEDNSLIYKRQVSTLELEYNDVKKKLETIEKMAEQEASEKMTLKATISQTSASFLEVEAQIRAMKLKLEVKVVEIPLSMKHCPLISFTLYVYKRADSTLAERERQIEQLKQELSVAQADSERVEAIIKEEERTRKRLEDTIRELESRNDQEAKLKKKAVVHA